MKKSNVLFFAAALTTTLITGCLNSTAFDEKDFKLSLKTEVSGELSVDQINSSEVQIRNHTKSIDIAKIQFRELAENDDVTAPEPGRLTAQISGAPTAGTQESIFLRPWKKYRIDITWREAKPHDGEYYKDNPNGLYKNWDWGQNYIFGDPNKYKENASKVIENLPRGKYVVHVYRTVTGAIQISIDDDWSALTGNDHHHDADFNLNVKPQINVDLSGMTVNVIPPRDPVNINVDFSDSVKNLLSVKFDNITKSIDNLRNFPKGYGLVVVKNRTSQDVSLIEFTKETYDRQLNLISAGSVSNRDESVGVLMTAGAPKVTLRLAGTGAAVGPKTVNVADNKITYVHLYETGGRFEIEVNDNPVFNYQLLVKTTSEYDKYGSLTVYNMTSRKIDDVIFYDAQGRQYFNITDISRQGSKGPALNGDQNIYALVGNYRVGIHVVGYSMDIFDRKIESLLYHGATALYVYEGSTLPANAPPGASVLLAKNLRPADYILTANGSAPTGQGSGSTTTEVRLAFDEAVSITPADIAQTSAASDAVITGLSGAGKNWTLDLIVNKSHPYGIRIDKAGIAGYEHTTAVYRKNDTPPVIQPKPPVDEITVLMGGLFPPGFRSASSAGNPNVWKGINVGDTLTPSSFFYGSGSAAQRQAIANQAVYRCGPSIQQNTQSNGNQQWKALAKDADAWMEIEIPASINNGTAVVCRIEIQ